MKSNTGDSQPKALPGFSIIIQKAPSFMNIPSDCILYLFRHRGTRLFFTSLDNAFIVTVEKPKKYKYKKK
jgi:hypothetical protein